MRFPAGFRLGAAALAVAAGSCGPDTITLPTPPMAAETAQLVAIYDMPTATLDTSNIDQVRSDAQARLADLHLDWLPGQISDLLTRLRQRLDAGGLPDDPATTPDRQVAQVTAVANLRRICAGWDNPAGAPDEAANGALDVTAIVDTGAINPEVWGTATACRARFPPADTAAAVGAVVPTVVNASLDGTLIIYLLAPLPKTAADAQFLVTFSGSIGANDLVKSVSFDFEIVNASVRFRVPVASGGDAIVTVGATLGVQGANAGFSCDVAGLTCQSNG